VTKASEWHKSRTTHRSFGGASRQAAPRGNWCPRAPVNHTPATSVRPQRIAVSLSSQQVKVTGGRTFLFFCADEAPGTSPCAVLTPNPIHADGFRTVAPREANSSGSVFISRGCHAACCPWTPIICCPEAGFNRSGYLRCRERGGKNADAAHESLQIKCDRS
jgi:hypothetical protein